MVDVQNTVGKATMDRVSKLGVWEVKERRATFRYIAMAIGGFLEPLEQVKNIWFAGDLPHVYYHKFCKQRRTGAFPPS